MFITNDQHDKVIQIRYGTGFQYFPTIHLHPLHTIRKYVLYSTHKKSFRIIILASIKENGFPTDGR